MAYSKITGSGDSTIHTSAEGLRHGMAEIPVRDGTMSAYYAAPAAVERPPVILVIQEIFGLHEHIRDICRRLAHEGYMAVALELYQRQGDAGQYGDIAELIRDIVAKVPDEQVLGDLDSAVEWAAGQGANAEQLGVTGFCWGGRLTWLYAAHNPRCRAAVAWYGRLTVGHGPLQVENPIDVAGRLHAPVLGLYGGQDAGIPLEDVRRMEEALAGGNEAARASRIEVYPESDHAFYADYRPSYNARDASDAWGKAVGWFDRLLD
ncbi:dienelactone hydrolase family protein [Alcaligenaceae bacterium]|nr:dienelactone hydrolase family protein [Alcaligenaceae bacterium]